MAQPEQQARQEIDRLLAAAGWRVFDLAEANIHAAHGVAIRELGRRIKCREALRLVERALITPTVPKNTRKRYHSDFRPKKGVPQGLSISNILAAIYMEEVDDAMQSMEITYYRYVSTLGNSQYQHRSSRNEVISSADT